MDGYAGWIALAVVILGVAAGFGAARRQKVMGPLPFFRTRPQVFTNGFYGFQSWDLTAIAEARDWGHTADINPSAAMKKRNRINPGILKASACRRGGAGFPNRS